MSYTLNCDWRGAFVPDPTKTPRLGYLVWFQGLGMGEYLKRDIICKAPSKIPNRMYTGIEVSAKGTFACTGVIESLSWAGGVRDPLCLSAYVSQESAARLKETEKAGLTSTVIKKLAWWIVGYSSEGIYWYEEAFPKDPVTGVLNSVKGDVRLSVARDGERISPEIDVPVYKFYCEVIPLAKQSYSLVFATSPKAKSVCRWG